MEAGDGLGEELLFFDCDSGGDSDEGARNFPTNYSTNNMLIIRKLEINIMQSISEP